MPKRLPVKTAVLHPTTKDIAWAAGIFEGEGYCGKNTTTDEAEVSQRDPWLCYRLQELFGGTVLTCKNQGSFKRNVSYRWRISGPRARGFLMTIYSFLSPWRKEQARKVLIS